MKTFSLLLIGCQIGILALGASPVAAQMGRLGGGDPLQWFDKADTNRDGRVTSAEFSAFRQSQFGQLDRNGDGVVSPTDFPRLAKLRPDAYAKLTGMIGQGDANGDGVVTRAEMGSSPPRMFVLADANGNGEVTRAEFDAARDRMQAAMAARRK